MVVKTLEKRKVLVLEKPHADREIEVRGRLFGRIACGSGALGFVHIIDGNEVFHTKDKESKHQAKLGTKIGNIFAKVVVWNFTNRVAHRSTRLIGEAHGGIFCETCAHAEKAQPLFVDTRTTLHKEIAEILLFFIAQVVGEIGLKAKGVAVVEAGEDNVLHREGIGIFVFGWIVFGDRALTWVGIDKNLFHFRAHSALAAGQFIKVGLARVWFRFGAGESGDSTRAGGRLVAAREARG